MIRGDDGKVKPIAAIDRSTTHNEMVFILADESCKKYSVKCTKLVEELSYF